MLKELRVKNFAIIDELSVDFGPGLNVLTGETGAGKSIIIGALGIALGQRAYTEMIKTGADEAVVEAFFDIERHPYLEELGIDGSDGIIIRRVVSRSSKTKAYINDTIVNLQSLNSLGKMLVDIHGQNEHQSLLSPENQLRLLDHFGGLDTLRAEVAEAFNKGEALRRKVEAAKAGARESAQKLDLLKFQTNEIEAASLEDGEDVKLAEERTILANLSRLTELTESAYEEIYGSEGAAIERLSRAVSALKEMSSMDKSTEEVIQVLQQALAIAEDASHSLRAYKDRYDADPARLEAVEDRIELIKKLKKKYGETVADVLSYLEKAKGELASIETSDESIGEMEEELKKNEEAFDKLAGGLSKKRRKVSGGLESSIIGVLKDLALEKSNFKVDIRPAPASSTGADEVELLFSANKGEDLKPLVRVASGGELSRIMLAIKSVLRGADEIPVLVFDEVDMGIGGKTAQNVARKLKETSKDHQVLLITHLPQIASAADIHAHIHKDSAGKGVKVTLRTLSGKDRQEEIARMLSGRITEASLKHARELIEKNAGNVPT
jgi:DNA repair protein RecN (Recombination protein N)